MKEIQMVDLKGQYQKIKPEIDAAILNCIDQTAFINGPEVKIFSQNLANYLQVKHVIPCANGTDALQIALMSMGLKHGDEVIVPAFTYVATAEVIGLLGLVPVIVDVNENNFNITADLIKPAITEKTKAIVPVHLFGQCVDMEPVLQLAREFNLKIIEDTAQAIGSEYRFRNGDTKKAGTMGDIGCTSFFPSKNLGCYGDGGAIYTNDDVLALKIRTIANHGQEQKYIHKYIGVNSRLDSIQAAILDVKLKQLDQYSVARNNAAGNYDQLLKDIKEIEVPVRTPYSTHVFHQYTMKIKNGKRTELLNHLKSNGIPSMVYYPIPLQEQEAYKEISRVNGPLSVTTELCKAVLSLPMHTELTLEEQTLIVTEIKKFFGYE